MILLIKTNKEKLHDLEFVKPISDLVNNNQIIHYSKLTPSDLEKAERVIICGTSLKDNEYMEYRKFFGWLKEFSKPVLGICAGAQVIGLIFGGKLKKYPEIGLIKIKFNKEFLGVSGEKEIYELHNNYIKLTNEFEILGKNKISQAFKHKKKKIYGCLFHPEVRNKSIIENFLKI
jgi:GMP synthase (glutamine-hydrolysing)